MGIVRGYKVNSELEGWNDASTCWCKEKSSTVKCGEGTIFFLADGCFHHSTPLIQKHPSILGLCPFVPVTYLKAVNRSPKVTTVREATYQVLRDLGRDRHFHEPRFPAASELPFLKDMPADFDKNRPCTSALRPGMALGYAMRGRPRDLRSVGQRRQLHLPPSLTHMLPVVITNRAARSPPDFS